MQIKSFNIYIFMGMLLCNLSLVRCMEETFVPKQFISHFDPAIARMEIDAEELENISPEVVDLMYGIDFYGEDPELLALAAINEPRQESYSFSKDWYEDNDLVNVIKAIKKGAPVNEQKNSMSPLRYAVIKKNIPLIVILVKAGANPTKKDRSGLSPFDTAVQLLSTKPNDKKLKTIVNFLMESLLKAEM